MPTDTSNTPPPQDWSNLVQNVLNGTVRNVLTHAFEACRIPECTRRSLGFVCSQCSKTVCQGHVYLTLAYPPQPVCALCISQEFEEETRPNRGRRSAKAAEQARPVKEAEEVVAEVVRDDEPASTKRSRK